MDGGNNMSVNIGFPGWRQDRHIVAPDRTARCDSGKVLAGAAGDFPLPLVLAQNSRTPSPSAALYTLGVSHRHGMTYALLNSYNLDGRERGIRD